MQLSTDDAMSLYAPDGVMTYVGINQKFEQMLSDNSSLIRCNHYDKIAGHILAYPSAAMRDADQLHTDDTNGVPHFMTDAWSIRAEVEHLLEECQYGVYFICIIAEAPSQIGVMHPFECVLCRHTTDGVLHVWTPTPWTYTMADGPPRVLDEYLSCTLTADGEPNLGYVVHGERIPESSYDYEFPIVSLPPTTLEFTQKMVTGAYYADCIDKVEGAMRVHSRPNEDFM